MPISKAVNLVRKAARKTAAKKEVKRDSQPQEAKQAGEIRPKAVVKARTAAKEPRKEKAKGIRRPEVGHRSHCQQQQHPHPPLTRSQVKREKVNPKEKAKASPTEAKAAKEAKEAKAAKVTVGQQAEKVSLLRRAWKRMTSYSRSTSLMLN